MKRNRSAPLSNSEEPETGNPAPPLREGDWERILAIIAYMYIDKEIPEITS